MKKTCIPILLSVFLISCLSKTNDVYNLDSLDKRIENLCSEGQFSKAIIICDSLIKVSPSQSRGYSYKGLILYNQSNYGGAINALEKAIKIDTTDALAFNYLGLVFTQQGNAEKALNMYNKAIKLNDKIYEFYHNRGTLYYMDLLDYDAAIQDFTFVIENDSTNNTTLWKTLANRGICYTAQKHYDLALIDLSRSLKFQESDETRYCRGCVNWDIDNIDKAIEDFEILISKKSENYYSDALDFAGRCYYKKGNISKGCEYFNLAIQNGCSDCLERKEKFCK